ncbi:MAG: hypothetical protein KF696_05875 [Planctomycetes bacterium]|nr:hypothetical protein [Planctomycetota bacterium]MCW8136415.1 hypothetical protein [Planctomycetota bacterium]
MTPNVPEDVIQHIDAAIRERARAKAASMLPTPKTLLASPELASKAWQAYCNWFHAMTRANIQRAGGREFLVLFHSMTVPEKFGLPVALFKKKGIPELRVKRTSKWGHSGWAPPIRMINPDTLAELLDDKFCRALIQYLDSAEVWTDVRKQLGA